ncbi:MAG TPA: alpha/beta hydrolase [Rhizomicrobium sp.]|nr:alpha/beta hydrolase [Rhizomicrobium sp.]
MRTWMAVRTGFAVLLAFLAAPAMAAGKAPAPPPDLGQPVAFPGGVMASPNLIYAEIDGFRPLTLDLYQIPPKPKETPRPAILFVHGGLWSKGDTRHATGFDDFPGLLASLSAKNYVVASVNYRLTGEAHFPAAVQDVKSAVRWLRTHASDYGIDTTRVMVWGAEAGGQIAALVGTSCGVNVLEPAADATSKAPLASDCVQAVIDWAGPVDLTSWEPDAGHAQTTTPTPLGAYMGCEPIDCAPGAIKAASPIFYLTNMTPAFLIQHGAADALVPVAQSRALYDALQALHVPSTLVVYPEVGQNFARSGAPDPATQAKVISDMEDFIAKTFPPIPIAPAEKAPASKVRKKRR